MIRPTLLLAASLLCPGWALSQPAASHEAAEPIVSSEGNGLEESPAVRLRRLERLGRAQPVSAALALEGMVRTMPESDPLWLEAQFVRGLLLARSTQPAAAEAVVVLFDNLGRRGRLAQASSLLLRAEIDHLDGRLASAEQRATQAVAQLDASAPAAVRLRFLMVAGAIKDTAGQLTRSVGLLLEAVQLSDEVGDAVWRAASRTLLAYSLFQGDQIEAARRLNEEALSIASAAGDDLALARAWNTQSILAERFGTRDDEARAMRLAIEHAHKAGAAHEEALFLANLADLYLKQGDYPTALALSRQALPLVRARRNLDGEVVALANAGLALISMKRLDEGKRELEQAVAIDERRGSMLGVSQTLEEMGRYLEIGRAHV
jgi:tetratricopeptide (TPR) repeat protein